MKYILYLVIFMLYSHTNAQYTLKSLGLKGKVKKITISHFHALHNETIDSLKLGKGLFSNTIFFDKKGNYTKRIYKNIDEHLDMILGGKNTAIPTYKNNRLVEENIFDAEDKLLERIIFKHLNKDTVIVTRYKADGTLLQKSTETFKNEQVQHINANLFQNGNAIIKYNIQFKYDKESLETYQIFKEKGKDDLITKTKYLVFDKKGNWTKAYEENPYRWKKQIRSQEIEYY